MITELCWRIEVSTPIIDTYTHNHGCTVPHGKLFISLTGPLFGLICRWSLLTHQCVWCFFFVCMRYVKYVLGMICKRYECLFSQGYMLLHWFFAVTGAIKYVCWYVSGYVLEFFTHEFHRELWVLRGCRLPGIQYPGLRWSYKSRELSVKVRGVIEG